MRMEEQKAGIILVLMFKLFWLTCSGMDTFLCDSHINNIAQNDPPVSDVVSHFACALRCKMSANPCIAFHYSYFHDCYLYKDLPSFLPSNGLTCQLVGKVSATTQAASTTFTPQLSLQTSTEANDASKTVVIKNVSYANFSCYPQKLFAGSSYDPKIPMVGGRVADCRCEGGLYLQTGTYVNRTAITIADCFAACETIASPPCKALAFMEANNTCIIATTNNNGDSTPQGVLQCYT